MAAVRLEFAQFGHFDYFKIYRNLASTNIEDLWQPIGTSSTMYYEDSTVEPNLSYFYRVGVVRDSAEEFSEEINVITEVVFDPPYNLTVEFKNDGANRLELNWKLDGFVDEQRYYCSLAPIDTSNPPPPKAVLMGEVRTYIDTDIVEDQTYYICFSAKKNNVEKFSEIITVLMRKDQYQQYVVAHLHFDADFSDEVGGVWNVVGTNATISSDAKFGNALKLQRGSSRSSINRASNDYVIGVKPFTIEFFAKSDPSKNCVLFDMRKAEGVSSEIMIESDAGNLFFWQNGGYKIGPFPNKLNLLEYKHIALARDENNLCYLFCGGELLGTATVSTSFTSDTIVFGMSRNVAIGNKAYDLEGGIDEFRFTIGACRYTANFTPPNKPF